VKAGPHTELGEILQLLLQGGGLTSCQDTENQISLYITLAWTNYKLWSLNLFNVSFCAAFGLTAQGIFGLKP
jgi:hypothetical protein